MPSPFPWWSFGGAALGYTIILGLCVAGSFYALLRREFACFAAAAALRVVSVAVSAYPRIHWMWAHHDLDAESFFFALQINAIGSLLSTVLSAVGFILLTVRVYTLPPARR